MNKVLILTPRCPDENYLKLLEKLLECNYKLQPINSIDQDLHQELLDADIFLVYTKDEDPHKISVAIGMALALEIKVHIADLLKVQAPEAWTSLPVKFYTNSNNFILNFFFM